MIRSVPPLSPIRAALFDLDGTMLNSDDLHRETFKVVLEHINFEQRTGQRYDLAFYQKYISGSHNDLFVTRLLDPVTFPEYRTLEERRKVTDLKEALFREAFVKHRFPTLNGLDVLLASFDATSVPHACVTNAPRLNAETMLGGICLLDRFKEVLIIGDETEPKPSPVPYLHGIKVLSAILESRGESPLLPSECVVFEDSCGGINAGVAANANVIAVGTSNAPEKLIACGAVGHAADYSELTSISAIEAFILKCKQSL